MVARVSLGHAGEAIASPEVEGAAVDDEPADRGAVAADELRRRVHDDVGAPLERADEVRRGDGVVDDERYADLVGHVGHAPDVEHVVAGVSDALAEERLGRGAGLRTPSVDVVRVLDDRHLDPQLGERVVEQVVGAAVERRRRHDMVAGVGDVEDRHGRGGLPAAHGESPGNADGGLGRPLERGDPGLQRRLGRVHDAGVDVADLPQPEQGGGVLGIPEGVRGRLVDRHRPGPGGRVRFLPGVDLAGLESPLIVCGHGCTSVSSSACTLGERAAALGSRPQFQNVDS